MKLIRLPLACLVVSLLSSVGWAKKYTSLKVSDYKNLKIIVEEIGKNKAGVTGELVERAVKLRLMGNEIKIKPPSLVKWPDCYLYVRVSILPEGTAYDIDVVLRRYGDTLPVEAQAKTGIYFAPEQRTYGGFGTCGQDSSYVIGHLNRQLDKFILDYLESNIE
jgi:hypothetical protein